MLGNVFLEYLDPKPHKNGALVPEPPIFRRNGMRFDDIKNVKVSKELSGLIHIEVEAERCVYEFITDRIESTGNGWTCLAVYK